MVFSIGRVDSIVLCYPTTSTRDNQLNISAWRRAHFIQKVTFTHFSGSHVCMFGNRIYWSILIEIFSEFDFPLASGG